MSKRAVLDTNVVLDWLLFQDPCVVPIKDDVVATKLIVVTHPLAIDELERVLCYDNLKLDQARRSEIVDRYRKQTTRIELPPEVTGERFELPDRFPRCRDRSDQYLLALAYHGKAELLISYDKQVLALAKRAAAFGLSILAPKDYSAAYRAV